MLCQTGGSLTGKRVMILNYLCFDSLLRASCSTNGSLANISSSRCLLRTDERLYIYTGVTSFAVIMSFVRAMGFYYLCVNVARVLHNRMFRTILRVPIHFFDTNPSGKDGSAVIDRFEEISALGRWFPYLL